MNDRVTLQILLNQFALLRALDAILVDQQGYPVHWGAVRQQLADAMEETRELLRPVYDRWRTL